MGNRWFPSPPPKSQLSAFQCQALVRFRRLLEASGPVRTRPEATEARLNEDGFLYLAIRHESEDFEAALYVNDRQVVAAWGSLDHEEITMADYSSGETALLAALDFMRHVILGRFETETIYRHGRPALVTNYLVDENGARSPIGATGTRLLNPFAKQRAEVRRVSFVD